MKLNKEYWIALIIIGASFSGALIYSAYRMGEIITSTILIDGNDALDAFCPTTSGTQEDPHIIQLLDFNAGADLAVRNTDRFLIIQYNTFADGKLALLNVSNAEARYNQISSTGYNGIEIMDCADCLIFNNTIIEQVNSDPAGWASNANITFEKNYFESGMYANTFSIYNSVNFTFKDNIFASRSSSTLTYGLTIIEGNNYSIIGNLALGYVDAGFRFYGGFNSTISENLASNCGKGFLFHQDFLGSVIWNNTALYCQNGFYYFSGSNIELVECNAIGKMNAFSVSGFYMSQSINCSIKNSSISNEIAGLSARDCFNITIDRLFSVNTSTGISFSDVSNSSICNSSFTGVIYSGINIQAFTASENNTIFNNTFRCIGDMGNPLYIMERSNYNLFILNLFDSGRENAGHGVYESSTIGNIFNNSEWGNYWCQYEPKYPLALNDGVFWDWEYEVGENINDSRPLVYHKPPVLLKSNDVAYHFSATGYKINWTILDRTNSSETTYQITRDDIPIVGGYWENNVTIVWNVDGLAVGSYIYQMNVTDGYFNRTEIIQVLVTNDIPITTHPLDILYELTSLGHVINWGVADNSILGAKFEVFRNLEKITFGSWISGSTISIDVDGLSAGEYIYLLNVSDGLGLFALDYVSVEVINSNPDIQALFRYLEVDWNAGIALNFTTIDPSVSPAPYYVLYMNGSIYQEGYWASGVPVRAELGVLNPGYYNFSFFAFDGYGHFDNVTIWVTILTPEIPETPNISSFPPIFLLVSIGLPIIMMIIKRKKSFLHA